MVRAELPTWFMVGFPSRSGIGVPNCNLDWSPPNRAWTGIKGP